MISRGQIVIVDFTPTNPKASIRPALVLQNDRDNARMGNTVIAQITSNLSRANLETQHLVDTNHVDWIQSGLRRASVVNCSNIATVSQSHVRKTIGSLSSSTMEQIEQCLLVVLDLS